MWRFHTNNAAPRPEWTQRLARQLFRRCLIVWGRFGMRLQTRCLPLTVKRTVLIALLGCVGLSQPSTTMAGSIQASGQSGAHPAAVVSTPMEAAVDALRARFPDQIVVGFEELWDARPLTEPQVDLGPPDSSLKQVIDRIRRANPQYKLDLLEGGLVHVYPAHGTADPLGLLDIKLREFFLPPFGCIPQQINGMDSLSANWSYTPELSEYLSRKQLEWNLRHGSPAVGVIGEFMGDCQPSQQRRDPIHLNITVREALNLMAIRSLQAALGPANDPHSARPKPISWKYRFRRDLRADNGLGGVPVFQTF
jgi:hypothetical protein